MKIINGIGLNIIFILIVVGAWFCLTEGGYVSPLVLPSPVTIANTLGNMLISGDLLSHIAISVARVFVGFTLAFIIAVPLGIAIAKIKSLRTILDPWIQFLQPIPSIAWVPFALLWFGLNNNAAIFVITIAAFFPIIINTRQAVISFPQNLINVSYTLGAKWYHIIYKVLLPGIVPNLIAGCKIGMGFAWRAVVAGEIIGIPMGVGFLLMDAKNTARMDIVIVSMITLGILMSLFDRIVFGYLEDKVSKWKG
jgi:ABC-type nitrate/sulfonate/bicarbonate transport system permease component